MKDLTIYPQKPNLGLRSLWRLVALSAAFVALLLTALPGQARGVPESFADLAEELSPSVVNITTTTTVIERSPGFRPIFPPGSPFQDLLPNLGPRGGEPRERKGAALGSGFVISADGFVVTNNHVIDKADEILIEFYDGAERDARVIGVDPKTDIALLKVDLDEGEALPFVRFGDSDAARVGDWVMAIGNPLGQGFSVSAGIISARNRALQGSFDDFIQTDAAINRGNSGGPLFNMDGEVIGVNTIIISPDGGSIGLGFSMSSAVVSKVVAQLKEFGETRRGWLGVQIQNIDAGLAEALGLDDEKGALVADLPEGPAAEAGIRIGDVITHIDGVKIEEIDELIKLIGNAGDGTVVEVRVIRQGETLEIPVTLGRREAFERMAAGGEGAAEKAPEADVAHGLRLSELTDELRNEMELDAEAKGVVVLNVVPESAAAKAGLLRGDLILMAGQDEVETPEDVTQAFAAAAKAESTAILLRVIREGRPSFIALEIGAPQSADK